VRWLFLASLLLSSRAVAEQVESQFGVLLEKGVSFGTGADGVISLTAPAHLNLEWSAFIEEDYRKRWRLGLVVPLQQRVALGLAPGLTIPLKPIFRQSFELGVGLRGFITPYTLYGAAVEFAWRPKLSGIVDGVIGLVTDLYFFGNDLPTDISFYRLQLQFGLRFGL
jgi:hypothetical protein